MVFHCLGISAGIVGSLLGRLTALLRWGIWAGPGFQVKKLVYVYIIIYIYTYHASVIIHITYIHIYTHIYVYVYVHIMYVRSPTPPKPRRREQIRGSTSGWILQLCLSEPGL